MSSSEVSAAVEQPPPNEDLAEEIDAINAIYGPDTITSTTTAHGSSSRSANNAASDERGDPIQTTVILRLPEHEHLSSFLIGFDGAYPSTPPRALGTASTSARGEGKRWTDILSDAVARVWVPGSVCLFDVIVDAGEKIGEVVRAQSAGGPAKGEEEKKEDKGLGSSEERISECNTMKSREEKGASVHNALGLESPPDWILSQVVTEKKSVFVARAASVQTKDQAETYLDHLLATEKKVTAATHNITAWRIREKQENPSTSTGPSGPGHVTIVQDYDDDGEAAAGGRLLHVMQMMDVWNVLVVVSRWYGGVKLGPDRFRIINAAARDALVSGGFDKSDSADAQGKGKKKGKR